MKKRRDFLKMGAGLISIGLGCFLSPLFTAVRWTSAGAKKMILPKGTKLESLINKNPENLDTRNLEVTALEDFGIMGLSDYEQNMAEWRLEVVGRVNAPLTLTYQEVQTLPTVEREVLLICPGFFANHGRWKGISMPKLLRKANMENDVTHMRFSGPIGIIGTRDGFPNGRGVYDSTIRQVVR